MDGKSDQEPRRNWNELHELLHSTWNQIFPEHSELNPAVVGTKTSRKHTIIELIGGKYDAMVLDSNSGDRTERELVRLVQSSPYFTIVERVETDTEVWLQLSCLA